MFWISAYVQNKMFTAETHKVIVASKHQFAVASQFCLSLALKVFFSVNTKHKSTGTAVTVL